MFFSNRRNYYGRNHIYPSFWNHDLFVSISTLKNQISNTFLNLFIVKKINEDISIITIPYIILHIYILSIKNVKIPSFYVFVLRKFNLYILRETNKKVEVANK